MIRFLKAKLRAFIIKTIAEDIKAGGSLRGLIIRERQERHRA